VLATQFIMEWERRVRQGGRSERLPVNILTGEAPHDPKFEAGLTFATIDQVWSSYLLAPYSLSSRLANFNAGAIVSSYLVFDEFHLFDPHSTLPTTLERSEEHTSELQSRENLVCRLLLEKKK